MHKSTILFTSFFSVVGCMGNTSDDGIADTSSSTEEDVQESESEVGESTSSTSTTGSTTESSSSSTEGEECPVGSEGCPCTEGGFCDGNLVCLSNLCVFDPDADSTSSAETDTGEPSVCGDGLITGDEDCDGSDLAGANCQTFGFDQGTLICHPETCKFYPNNCSDWVCGNSILEPNEECDNNKLGGETCYTQGFDGGPLSCNANCTINVSACETFPDGNCCADWGEAGCDGDPVVEACVCILDPWCCSSDWDASCAQEGIDSCGAVCW